MAEVVIDPVAGRVLAFVVGLAVGSFLNVLAIRTLSGTSIIWPPSSCPACRQRLSLRDNIPLLSFIFLKGKCRSCQAPISWQYPIVELTTGLSFVVLVTTFGFTLYTAGLAVFACTLIAVTVTDLKEKLIPHDITYPSMIAGIAFSALLRKDLLGAMAGVGASYIIFDFLAHYGLKLYLAVYGGPPSNIVSTDSVDPILDAALKVGEVSDNDLAMDEFEVMGGGDAVLSAVISAWLGWQRLIVALVVGFMIGTIIGIWLLLKEMHKEKILTQCYRPALLSSIFGFFLLASPAVTLSIVSGLGVDQVPWLTAGLLGALAGCVLGIVSVGTKVSKPFPFGPALAIGGAVAIFFDPIGTLLTGGA